jgi:hypothetical protein
MSILRSAALTSVLALSACYDLDRVPVAQINEPVDYSPEYTYVDMYSESGRHKKVLVPEACLTPEAPYPADSGPPRLPPGCANNYNLERMVERKRDLKQGRRLGPAPAAPAARAAKAYIEGTREPTVGGGVSQEPASTMQSGKTSTEPNEQ